MVNLTPADISDSARGPDDPRRHPPSAGHGSSTCSPTAAPAAIRPGRQLMDKAAFLDFVLEVVRRIDHEPGFKVLPRRWVVRAHLRLDDPMAPPGARLRAAHRRLRGHDPRRHGKTSPAPHQPLKTFSNGLLVHQINVRQNNNGRINYIILMLVCVINLPTGFSADRLERGNHAFYCSGIYFSPQLPPRRRSPRAARHASTRAISASLERKRIFPPSVVENSLFHSGYSQIKFPEPQRILGLRLRQGRERGDPASQSPDRGRRRLPVGSFDGRVGLGAARSQRCRKLGRIGPIRSRPGSRKGPGRDFSRPSTIGPWASDVEAVAP